MPDTGMASILVSSKHSLLDHTMIYFSVPVVDLRPGVVLISSKKMDASLLRLNMV